MPESTLVVMVVETAGLAIDETAAEIQNNESKKRGQNDKLAFRRRRHFRLGTRNIIILLQTRNFIVWTRDIDKNLLARR
jgi:hypothetical protein